MAKLKTYLTIHSKVTGAALGASLSTITCWILGLHGVDVPRDVNAAFTVCFTILGGWLAPA